AGGGLGVGLALARRLVELHDGEIDLRSDGPGRGTEVVIRLPVLEAARVIKPVTEEKGAAAACPTLKVLVVDDNRDAAETMATLLTRAGNEVRMAYDGIEAVDTAAAWSPDVVLLDVGLPRLDGYGAARRIRAQAGDRPLLLVALTG